MKKTKGFTLVEVLVAMSLTVLVCGVLFLLQSSGMTTVKKGSTQVLLASEARNKMEYIVRDFRNAKEILELTKSSVKLRTYSDNIPEAGDSSLITVQYEIEKRDKNCVLWRIENKSKPQSLLTAEKIDENLFKPYYERLDETSVTGWVYLPYDLVSNDSWQRQFITYVQIRLSLENAGEKAVLTTDQQKAEHFSLIGNCDERYILFKRDFCHRSSYFSNNSFT